MNFLFIAKPFIKPHTAGSTPLSQAEALEKETEAALPALKYDKQAD